MSEIHSQILSAEQICALTLLGNSTVMENYYLAGGTALALILGHRFSEDFDWFTPKKMQDPLQFASDIRHGGIPFQVTATDRGTLHGSINGVRVTFLEYRYPLLAPSLIWSTYSCRLASLDDLFCMKLAAIASRGSKKDFVDIYALGLQYGGFAQAFNLYNKKFSVLDIGHLLYSLNYFDDAEKESMPRLVQPTDWETMKSSIQKWVRQSASNQ